MVLTVRESVEIKSFIMGRNSFKGFANGEEQVNPILRMVMKEKTADAKHSSHFVKIHS